MYRIFLKEKEFKNQQIPVGRSLAVLFVCLLALAAGCSKKQIKPVPEGAVYFNKADAVVQALRRGYASKDSATIKAVSTEKGYADIIPNLDRFDTVKLTFTTKWIDVSSKGVTVNVQWSGVWTKDGKKDSERGMAVLELTGKPLKFNAVLTGNPFIYPQ